MRLNACIVVVSIVGVLSAGREAFAQDASGTPNQPPSVSPAAPPPLAFEAARTDPSLVPAPIGEREDTEREEKGRLRIGFNLGGGVGSGDNISGPAFVGTFRIGWQLNRLIGLYGQLSALGWAGSNDGQTNVQKLDISVIGGYQFTPMFSITPVDLLEIAAGPSLDRLTGGSVSVGQNSSSTGGFDGFYFAAHGRVALHLGGRNARTGRRTSFTIGGDVHPTFAEGSVITFYTVGLGADWY